MKNLKNLEDRLVPLFDKLPKISDVTADLLVKFWPWLSLIGGLFQLFAAWSLYVWARGTRDLIQYADTLHEAGIDVGVTRWDFWTVTAFIILIIDAVVLLLAFPKLQARLKSGWYLMLVSAFLSLIYSLGALILRYRGSVLEDIWSLLVALVVFYLLFQVRSKYAVRPKRRK